MWCYRCGGVMIDKKFYGDCEHFFGCKCISCGEIVDPVILENRHHSYRQPGPGACSLCIRDKMSDEAGGIPPLLHRHHHRPSRNSHCHGCSLWKQGMNPSTESHPDSWIDRY